ncbi:MAG TPA: hypothetical protein VFV50_11805 [Bdellovibrionales bacterium]|nr:hypothetical protein [Bdellovibrionales bacterium]
MKALLAALFVVFAGLAANADLIRPPMPAPMPPPYDSPVVIADMRVTSATGQFAGTTYARVEVYNIRRSLKKYVLLHLGNRFNRGLRTINLPVVDTRTNRCGTTIYTGLEQRMGADIPLVSIDVIDNTQSVCAYQNQVEAKVVKSGGIVNLVHGTLTLEGSVVQSR